MERKVLQTIGWKLMERNGLGGTADKMHRNRTQRIYFTNKEGRLFAAYQHLDTGDLAEVVELCEDMTPEERADYVKKEWPWA